MKKLLLMIFVLFAVSFGNAQESIPPSNCEQMSGYWYYCEDAEMWQIIDLIRSVCGDESPSQLHLIKKDCND